MKDTINRQEALRELAKHRDRYAKRDCSRSNLIMKQAFDTAMEVIRQLPAAEENNEGQG